MKWEILIVSCISLAGLNAQVPKIGEDNRLDVATWNIEWFGDANNGPSNESVQLNYAAELINKTDLDIIGVQEISNISYWNQLLAKCPNYAGVLSTWSQTQKTGLLYKKAAFDYAYQKHILANYDYDFGSGRLPLEVGLIPKIGQNQTDTFRVWVLHMKANTGSSSQKVLAYNRRYNAGLALKLYVDGLPKSYQGLVMGDWNDDFDQSILSGYATPYPSWVKDTAYVVTSLPLSQAREKSTVSYYEMIDHVVASPALKSRWIKDSSMVLYADKWLSGYGNNVSDHYPVYARFTWNTLQNVSTEQIVPRSFTISNDGNGFFISWEDGLTPVPVSHIQVYDMLGRSLHMSTDGYLNQMERNTFYIIRITNGKEVYSRIFAIDDNDRISYR